MIKFRTAAGIFFFLLVILLIVYFFYWNSIFPLLFLILFFVTVLALGAGNIASGMFVEAKCKADTTQKLVALSFDDGPSEHTHEILDILSASNVKAGFFCIGKNAEKHKAIVERIDREGHVIGNHTYNHHFLIDFLSSKRMFKELQKTDELIKNITGKKLRLFRPPFGVTNPAVKYAVEKQNYIVVGWSLRTYDGISSNQKKIIGRIRKQLKPGCIILLHDSRAVTKTILQEIITIIRNENYEIIRPDILLNIKAYDNETNE